MLRSTTALSRCWPFTASKWEKENLSIDCSIKLSVLGVLWDFTVRAPPRALTLIIVSFCVQLCSVQRSTRWRFHLHFTISPPKRKRTNVVNTEGQNICPSDLTCEHIAELLTSDEKDELNLCVLVVYMVFWFWYSTFEPSIYYYYFFLKSAVNMNCKNSAFGCCWQVVTSYQMCIVLWKRKKWRDVHVIRCSNWSDVYFQVSAQQEILK